MRILGLPRLVVLVLGMALGACTSIDAPTSDDRMLAYGCDDIVVIGRLQNGAYEHIENEDDILGHGWISANVTVREVVKGNVSSDVIPVRYIAHTYMRDDVEFMFVLRRTERGPFVLRTAQLMATRPYLAARCEPPEA